MLIIWLQGIWLPQHGFNFTDTPLWAGIYMLPLTIGMLLAGPTSGVPLGPLRRAALRHCGHALHGAQLPAARCCSRSISRIRCSRSSWRSPGISFGMFASPNRAAVMNSLPPCGSRRRRRHEPDLPELGAGDLDRDLLHADDRRARGDAARRRSRPGCTRTASAQPPHTAPPSCRRSRSFSPRSSATTRSSTCSAATSSPRLSAHDQAVLTGRSFFPHLISGPFQTGLHEAFLFAIVACLVAAAASALRGGRYEHAERPAVARRASARPERGRVAGGGKPIREEQHAG